MASKLLTSLFFVLLFFLFAAEGLADETVTPLISEFMAINGGKAPLEAGELLDEDGDSSDWIEIYNPTNQVLDLESWYLTDNPDNLTKWEFPPVRIEPGRYMIVFASGKDRDDPDGVLHTNFKLSGSPGFLALIEPDERTIAQAYAYPQQFGNISYGLSSDSTDASSIEEGYFPDPTPGRQNRGIVANPGPAIRDVTASPTQPNGNEDILVTARVTGTFEPVEGVSLVYRVNFGSSIGTQMYDDGLHNDGAANDGLYAAFINAVAYGSGDMVRWKIFAYDAKYNVSQNPLFLLRDGVHQSPEYFGTVVNDPSMRTDLPVFEYFVEDSGVAGTRTGTRTSVFYGGEFYDNVFVRLRGGYTTHGRKFEFNDGHHFRFDPNLPRVDEINLNERGADPTYIRQVLGWETYANAGQPGSIAFPMHIRRNGSYLGVRIFVEQPDRDMLRRNNLDPDGTLYKMYDDLQDGRIDGEGVHRKKTRLNEDASDLLALAGGIDTRNPNRDTFLFDNVNIPAMINYWAASVIMHENDKTHKNYYAYRNTWDPVNNPNGTNEWMFLPWDKDLTFGLNSGISGVIADQDWAGDVRSPSHPFFGCSEHQKVDRQWNCLIDALHDNPVTRQMYLRRLRTLMDDLLQPPGTPSAELKFEKRIDELQAQLEIELGGSSFRNNVNRIKTDYLAVRRRHLFYEHSIHNPGYDQNAGIPDAQPADVRIDFGTVDFNLQSGNQDEEYIELINPNPIAVDITGWSLEGGIEHIFPPGTVIPAYDTLYVTPSAVAFRNRSISPKGGEQRLVQGNYKGHLSNWGETIDLVDNNGVLVSTITYEGNPSDQQRYLRITEIMYNPAGTIRKISSLVSNLDIWFPCFSCLSARDVTTSISTTRT